ncbi:hypothetical protein ACHAXT_009657 [Thalassiosira profunda]
MASASASPTASYDSSAPLASLRPSPPAANSDDGRAASAATPTASHDSSAGLTPLRPSPPGAAAAHLPLITPGDEEWLTPVHCFVRSYCVEFFEATDADVAAPSLGTRGKIRVGQVGIRCGFCGRSEAKEGKSDASRDSCNVFPSVIGRIYNAVHTLILRHLNRCSHVPPEVLARYEKLQSSGARSGASKKYWEDSAAKLGLVNTEEGLRLDAAKHRTYLDGLSSGEGTKGAKASGKAANHSAASAPLVIPIDKRHITPFTYHLLLQMRPCAFTEADRVGKRKNTKVGHPGLACRHCLGLHSNGRFFPRSVKTLADASKTLDPAYRHMLGCESCPSHVKEGLQNLRMYHDDEKKKLPFGSWKSFFVKVFDRLHRNELVHDDMVFQRAMASRVASSSSPLKVPALDTPAAVGKAEGKGKTEPEDEGLYLRKVSDETQVTAASFKSHAG